MALRTDGYDIAHAQCECPAGIGPHGSCKHIAALSYTLADFCRRGELPEFLTCTDQLQQWNRTRGRRVEPIPVDQLGARRRELFPSKRAAGSKVIFDPRPQSLREPDPIALEDLRCDLISLGMPCGLLSILVPSVQKVEHDHCYLSDKQGTREHCTGFPTDLSINIEEKTKDDILENLSLTAQQRIDLEKKTRSQASSAQWYEARRCRITGSKCGKVLLQTQKTVALLRFCIYPKPMLILPKPLAWGKKNEHKACLAYVNYMQLHGHPGLKTTRCGFVVHQEKCWLGASPDAWVTDPSANAVSGIVEFKCPYNKAELTPEEACKDLEFYCSMVSGNLHLKRNHSYFHQVQLQLYVASDLCDWCDFCIYTTHGVAVERIYPDSVWQQTECPKLDSYFF